MSLFFIAHGWIISGPTLYICIPIVYKWSWKRPISGIHSPAFIKRQAPRSTDIYMEHLLLLNTVSCRCSGRGQSMCVSHVGTVFPLSCNFMLCGSWFLEDRCFQEEIQGKSPKHKAMTNSWSLWAPQANGPLDKEQEPYGRDRGPRSSGER